MKKTTKCNILVFILSTILMLTMPGRLYASVNLGEQLWQNIADMLSFWLIRIGGVVAFVGALMFALGWQSDDPERRSKGMTVAVAGIMFMGIAGAIEMFFFL